MFYIYWRSKRTNATGHGTKAVSREIAEAWIKALSEECTYWLVAVEE